MLTELLAATGLVLFTLLMHGVGLYAIGEIFKRGLARHGSRNRHPLAPRSLALSLILITGLFVLHGAEIWFYALFFLAVDAAPNLEEAVYFSTISYSTIGYDDEGIDPAWKLVGAVEGVNGILLLGWSTAFVVQFMGRLTRR
jgi:hypothetical protein